MVECLLGCHVAELVEREGAEGSAAGREDEFLYGAHLAHQTLEDGTVLAIDGQQGHLVLQAEAGDEFACHDQRLLVGQGDGFPCLDCTDGRAQAAEAHEGCQHDIDRLHLHHLAEGVGSGIDLYGLVLQGVPHVVVFTLVGYHHAAGLVLPCLPDEQVGIPACRQHVCLEEVGVLADDLKRLSADAPRGAQYADSFHLILILMLQVKQSFGQVHADGSLLVVDVRHPFVGSGDEVFPDAEEDVPG